MKSGWVGSLFLGSGQFIADFFSLRYEDARAPGSIGDDDVLPFKVRWIFLITTTINNNTITIISSSITTSIIVIINIIIMNEERRKLRLTAIGVSITLVLSHPFLIEMARRMAFSLDDLSFLLTAPNFGTGFIFSRLGWDYAIFFLSFLGPGDSDCGAASIDDEI